MSQDRRERSDRRGCPEEGGEDGGEDGAGRGGMRRRRPGRGAGFGWGLPGRLAFAPRALLLALALALSCVPGIRAPEVAPSGTLAPELGEPGRTPDDAPFAVVFGGPEGETRDPAAITLVFNRPLRALEAAGDEAPPPVTLEPDVKGRWGWIGTSGLHFVPERALPSATAFSARVPKGTRALDGSVLAEDYVLRFATARPRVVDSQPPSEAEGIDLQPAFELRFNQPVAGAEIERALSLRAGGAPLPLRVERPDPENDKLARVTPTRPLPKDAAVTLEIGAGLRGKEGPLPSGKAEVLRFRTYGPLRAEVQCSRARLEDPCDPRGGVSLELSNPVKLGDLRRALRFEPRVALRFPDYADDAGEARYVHLDGDFEPARRYALRIDRSLRDVHGQAYSGPASRPVAFGDLFPQARIGASGRVAEAGAQASIPVAWVNAEDLELAVAALSEEELLRLEAGTLRHDGRFGFLAGLPGAKRRRLPAGPKNVQQNERVALADALGGAGKKAPKGAVGIGIAYAAGRARGGGGPPGRDRREEVTVVSATDLALSLKASPAGTLAWVTRLSDGKPVAGASVHVRTLAGPSAAFSTDAAGLATLPASIYAPGPNRWEERALFVAKLGEDWTYALSRDALGDYRFGVNVDLSPERPRGLVFTDRGIYRPGDAVRIKAIVRELVAAGIATPAGATLTLRLRTPAGEIARTERLRLSAYGAAHLEHVLPATAPIGVYALEGFLGTGGEERRADFTETFEVAEYRPAEFEVSVESGKPGYVRGEEAAFTASGDFLFGAPMASADARLLVTRERASFAPPGAEDFSFGDELSLEEGDSASPSGGTLLAKEEKLGNDGRTRVKIPLDLPGQRGPERVSCEATVADLSRQELSGQASVLVHPAAFYVGIRTKEFFVEEKKPVRVEVTAVLPSGDRKPGVKVAVDLVRRTYAVARQKAGSGFHTVNQAVDRVVGSCSATTGAAPAGCEVKAPEPGYYLAVARAKDARGNPVAASRAVYAIGAGSGGGVPWADGDAGNLDLVTDREGYAVGQTARLLVKNPFPEAEAWVTVERGGVLSQRRVRLSGPTPTVDVPVTEAMRPNAYVSVLLVKGRTKPSPGAFRPDVGAPAFRMGYAPILVSSENRRLRVALATQKSRYAPGDEVEASVLLRDASGRPVRGEVALYAVDEGVLSLVGYETPDPSPVFSAPRPLQVLSFDTRSDLLRIVNLRGALGLDKGANGGDGGGGGGMRRDFRAVAAWLPALLTDEKGSARAKFRLPDGLTTYRLMAVAAAEDDRFGFGEARITASKPLMARPAFPRIVRAGDALDAGVVVSVREDAGKGDLDVLVEASAEGLSLSGPKEKRIRIPKGGSAEVRFSLAATRAGKAKVTFRIRAGALSDAVLVERAVEAPALPEAVALYGSTEDARGERIGDLAALRSDVGGLELSLASTSLVGLGANIESLLDYPYLCAEQTASRLLPLTSLVDLARDYDVALPEAAPSAIAQHVAKLLSYQRPSGGFAYWEGSAEEDTWLSAYALFVLSEAKRRGAPVPEAAIAAAVGFVRGKLETGKLEAERAPFSLETSAFIVDVLASVGKPDPGRTSALFASREKLPAFAKALLLHAMVLGKAGGEGIATLSRELEGRLRIDANRASAVVNHGDAYAPLLDSEARTTALVLRALVAARPDHPLAGKLARGLLAARKGGSWRSTQETAFALLALDDYRKAQEKEAPDFVARVFLGETELFAAPFRGQRAEAALRTIPMARLLAAGGSVLAFDVEGSGKLFYEARLRYAKKELPKAPLERGFFVQKSMRAVRPEALGEALEKPFGAGASAFEGGDLVLVDLVVLSPSPREFVVVDDALPGGLEAVDASLATTARGLDIPASHVEPEGAEDRRDSAAKGEAYLSAYASREVRDDRVLFFADRMAAGMYRFQYLARATTLGRFVAPPTRVFEMYEPEVFGRTGAASVTVAARGERARP